MTGLGEEVKTPNQLLYFLNKLSTFRTGKKPAHIIE